MRQGLNLTVHRYGRRHRMRRQAAAAALALALACAALAAGLVLRFGPAAVAWLAALPARVETAVGDWLMPRYADLHACLADTAGLQAENEALRALLQSPAAGELSGAQPMPVAARTLDGFALAGTAAEGAAVLDPQGRFAGRAAPDPDAEPGVLPVAGPDGTACLAGGQYGVLRAGGGQWMLTGLPRHSGLEAGCVVTTADGYWVGTLAAAPAEDETGLCASALLADTADPAAAVYFAAG